MGNCQAAEAATVVIEQPGGKVERLYWPTAASEVMRSNPGHHVALVTLCRAEERPDGAGSVRVTRVKLLKPTDLLLIGQVYRLITTQEVTRALKARKYEKMKKAQSELAKQQQQQQSHRRVDDQVVEFNAGGEIDSRNCHNEQVAKHERDRQKGAAAQSAARSRQWRPSLQSISEGAS
ncbi:hypothetical protein ACMD2_00078 [Ananas comosus]|uniref:Uncharacterized protein n=1 Tax=Ananas comosus TaxID=4615 RepID=A0A199VPQ5_ANACO|nr:hypothetical protein ACMD2_00078 [Ananas comosus]